MFAEWLQLAHGSHLGLHTTTLVLLGFQHQIASLASTSRIALPGSRGIRIGWLQLLTFLPSPHGLLPLLTGNWALYAEHPDRMPHIFGRLDPATGSAILTFTGTYAPRSGSLWLSDVSHHHLALGIVALLFRCSSSAYVACGQPWFAALLVNWAMALDSTGGVGPLVDEWPFLRHAYWPAFQLANDLCGRVQPRCS